MLATIKIGRRWFAVPKKMGLAERVAAQTSLRGNWQNIMQCQKAARVIINHKR